MAQSFKTVKCYGKKNTRVVTCSSKKDSLFKSLFNKRDESEDRVPEKKSDNSTTPSQQHATPVGMPQNEVVPMKPLSIPLQEKPLNISHSKSLPPQKSNKHRGIPKRTLRKRKPILSKSKLLGSKSEEKENINDAIKESGVSRLTKQLGRLSLTPFNIEKEGKAFASLLKLCQQTIPIEFSTVLSQQCMSKMTKIGEATFSEVFMIPHSHSKLFHSWRSEDGYSIPSKQNVVVKVIPFTLEETEKLVNGEKMLFASNVWHECKVFSEISRMSKMKHVSGKRIKASQEPHFAKLHRIAVCQGEYPKKLIEKWNEYELEFGSENTCPTYFQSQQLYVVIAQEDAGIDLECIQLESWGQAKSILLQLLLAIAQAEKDLNFEHRDLHCGNVLIETTIEKYWSYHLVLKEQVESSSSNWHHDFKVTTCGIKATIIDFTISRISLGEGQEYWAELDHTFFEGEDDPQYDVYRDMRDITQNVWKGFFPETNIKWLYYLLQKVKESVEEFCKENKRKEKDVQWWQSFEGALKNSQSCIDFVQKLITLNLV